MKIDKYKHIPGYAQFVPRLAGPVLFIFWPIVESIFPRPFIRKFIGIPPDDALMEESEMMYRSSSGMISVITAEQPYVLISEPNLIKEVLVTKRESSEKVGPVLLLSRLFGPNLLSSVGEEWKKFRELTNPAFSESVMNIVGDVAFSNAKSLATKWEDLLRDKTDITLDAGDYMKMLTMNVISEVGFGLSLDNSSFNPYPEGTFGWAMKLVSQNAIQKALLPKFLFDLPLQKFKQIQAAFALFTSNIEQQMKNAKEKPTTDHKNVLSQLVGGTMTDREILGNMFMFYFSGHETTANTLTYTLRLIGDNPEVQEKMFKEVQSVGELGRDLSYSDYPNLPYCRAAFQETLRLYPASPFVNKAALEDLEIGGKKIPKDTIMQPHIWAVHRNPKYWENPDKYMPERFIDQQIAPFTYLPFSTGPRTCIGNKFALVEGTIVLAELVRHFTFALHDVDKGKPIKVKRIGLLIPKSPVKVIVKRR